MKKLAFYRINENTNPKSAAEALAEIKKSGFDEVCVFHEEGALITSTKYKEKLLALFRGAYRYKLALYIADDSSFFSGTAFSQLSGVHALKRREIVSGEKAETDEVKDGLILRRINNSFPDLTDPYSADLVTDGVYAYLIREFDKFAGYEFKGFVMHRPFVGKEAFYSADAVKKADINDKEKYIEALKECVEKNYIAPIRDFVTKNNMSLIVMGGEESVDEGREFEIVNTACETVKCVMDGKSPVIAFCAGMKEVAHIADMTEKVKDIKTFDVDGISHFEDSFLITNMSDEIKVRGILPKDGFALYDAQKDEYYDFEKDTYTLYPYTFLHVVKKGERYTVKPPVRVGGVLCGDFEEKKDVYFEKRDNKYAFYLPDEPLFGKGLEIVSDADCLKITLGGMEQTFVTKPFAVALFDFLRDAGCVIEVYGGEIEKINIIKR